ncbi:MAG: hypothetical protein CVT66_03005 [Actinobacteria bacterium HGW-Actinobacteria-6]|nr:MAG: hypothetical protein CVT66_03005 [Actinobacteria bacterium HGW-Actinobacteria-6]
MTALAQLLESLRPMLSIGWLAAALAGAGALAGLVADMFDSRKTGIALVALGMAAATVVSLAAALLPLETQISGISSTFAVVLTGAGFAGLASVVYFTAFLSCASGLGTVRENIRVPVAALIAVGAVAGQVLLGADDVLVLFVALELMALIAYALVAAAGTNRSDEAAIRYFVQGSVVTGLAVLGLAVLIGLGGGVSGYGELTAAIGLLAPGAALLGVVLLVSVLAFKVGAFPFHSWVPDAYENAPAGAAAFLSSGAKAAAIGGFTVLFARLLTVDPFLPVAAAVRIMAVASILFGNLAALRQTSVGRMLGYSGIAQVGYALIGLAISPRDTLLFASTYAVAAATAFVALEYFRLAEPGWDGSVAGLAGYGKTHRIAALSLTISLLSLTGMPLMAGFWGKFFVFYAAGSSGLLWLSVVGLIGSVISFGYYGRVIRSLYFDAASAAIVDQDEQGSSASLPNVWPSALGASVIVLTGIAPLLWGLQLVYALFSL